MNTRQYQFIETSIDDGIKLIAFNRPNVLNSFHLPMAEEVQQALDDAEHDLAVRVVIISGNGRAFCAGQDLEEALPKDKEPPAIDSIVEKSYNPVIKALRCMEKPVVAAVNGVAAGAGANIALACDFVIAVENASFIQSFVNIGLIPDSGGTFFLPKLVGMARAAELMMLGEKIPASEASHIGMIYKSCPEEEFEKAVNSLARRLAGMPTRALGLIKRALNASFYNDLRQQLDLEKRLQAQAGQTEDYLEGVNAFLEKRKPQFRGI